MLETFGAGKPPASHSKMTDSPSAAVWLSGSCNDKGWHCLHIAYCILHIAAYIAYIAYCIFHIAHCILLHIKYLMVRPWWSMERHGRRGWLNKTLQFPLRSRPRTCSPPRPRSPRALSQVSFRSYRTLSCLAVTPRLFLSIGSLAEASLRRCTTAEIQFLCERRAKVNLAFEQFDSVTNTYRLSEMSAAMGGPDFLPPSRM